MKLVYLLPVAVLFTGGVAIAAHFSLAKSKGSNIAPVHAVSVTTIAAKESDATETTTKPTGGLFVQSTDGKQQVFPLKHTDVKAKISGNVSRVEVTQTFENPFKNPLEAVYVFPLPDEAAVDDMEIKIGDRIIKGDIKKREEAKEIYEEARRQGRTAGLLEQERDNIFTQSLANIKPGEKIDVTIRYTESLKFEKGNYEFVFPMVVGPRYIPGNKIDGGGADTDRVPDASRINPPVLKPGTRSGHDISVAVELDAGVPIPRIWSVSHQLVFDRQGNKINLKLREDDNIPNKDLILRYEVGGQQTQATVLTQSDQRGGHFATYLIPAIDYRQNEIVPKDVVFLMDTSGSQSGDPLVKSQELMRRFINGLNPNDTFTIIDFANATQKLSETPLPNTAANRAKAIAYINKLTANGGTELLNGIREVLTFPPASSDRLRSIVLITDGYIGNENEVIAEVQRELKSGNRLYSFGVGSSVNRFILNRLAEVGRGTSQVIRQDEPTEEVAEKFFRQINNPVLTNIQVSWEGSGERPEIYPAAAPDLFANQPLVLFGRKKDRSNGNLRITGTIAGGKRYEKTINVNFDGSGNSAISQLWGRSRIKDLMNQMFGAETKSGVDAVTDTALNYRLLSQYTAFVAVSEEVRVNPDGTRQRVQVPVELPEGVKYEGIFGAADSNALGNTAGIIQSSPQSLSRKVAPFAPSRVNNVPTRTQGGGNRIPLPTAPPPVAPSVGDISVSESNIPAAKPRQDSDARNSGTQPQEAEKPKVQSSVSNISSRIQIISAGGLNASAIASLTQHLQNVTLPNGFSGEIVLEFPIKNGRVGRIVLDDRASTLKDAAVIDSIKRSLTTWLPPQSTTGTIRLKLQISP